MTGDLQAQVAQMQNSMLAIQEKALAAGADSATALRGQAAHEMLCTERYVNLHKRLDGVDQIRQDLGTVKQLVYIGVGIWIGVPVISGIVLGIYKLASHT